MVCTQRPRPRPPAIFKPLYVDRSINRSIDQTTHNPQSPLALAEPTKEMLVPGIMVVGASVLSWVRTYIHGITQPAL
jgi:hypothetical protein